MGVPVKTRAGLLQPRGKRLCEQVRIARFVAGGMHAPGQCRLSRGERGLDCHALRSRAHAGLDTQLRKLCHTLRCVRELRRGVEQMQDAARALLVFEPARLPQPCQALCAVHGERGDRRRVAATACGQTLTQKGQRPPPLRRIKRGAKLQRRIVASEPAQHQPWRCRVGPGLRMTDGDLATVGEARFEPSTGLTIDHTDFETGLLQIPGGADAGDAGAQNHDVHKGGMCSQNDSTSRARR